MKAIAINEFGGPDKLKILETAVPEPGETEVLIETHYAGVNPVDWKVREGYLARRMPYQFPIVLGWDVAGTVVKVGSKVKIYKPHDRVHAYARKPVVHSGTYAEYVTVDESVLAPVPDSLDFAAAASIPLAGLTAWQSLFDSAQLKAGETILIHAGSGGVGSWAIQFAKNAGATVASTAGTENQPYIVYLGTDLPIDYRTQDFVEVLGKHFPQGIDVVFDTVGGEIYSRSFEVLKKGGRIVSLLEQPDEKLAGAFGVRASYVFVHPDGEQLKQIGSVISNGRARPPEIHEFDLWHAAQALEESQMGHVRGKIVLKVKLH